jgi:uncharacterized membrane protein
MSGAWAIVPLIPLIIGVLVTAASAALLFSSATSGTLGAGLFAGFLGLFLVFYLSFFVLAILVAIMIFLLVRRRNTHFNRQILLYEDIVTVAREVASRRNVDVSILINNMERNVRETRLEEAEKNAGLYAILIFTPFALGLWYASYFLMKDFYRHERREDAFIQDCLRTFYALGISINLPYRTSAIPERSFALYFILTLITATIFSVYWVYVLVSDPNNHFKQQMLIEDTIMAQANVALSVSPPPPPPPAPKL